MKRENTRTNIKSISESLLAKPSNTSRFVTTKCILWSFGFAFGSCLLFGIVLFLYNHALQSKHVDSENNSGITSDLVFNTDNGSIVDMVNVNRDKIALNTSEADLPSDALSTVISPSGEFEISNKNV